MTFAFKKYSRPSLMTAALILSPVLLQHASAAETVKESTKEMGRDVSKTAKKGARSLEDKTCEMVNGKMECAAKRVKHSAKNTVDEVKDKADDKH